MPLSTVLFRNFTSDTGLPGASSPTAFSQDGEGFMWIGSQSGLLRWDGYRFSQYRSSSSAGSLPDSYITVLHTDAKQRLWVGTNVGGLARYDRDHDRFVSYGVRDGFAAAQIQSIADGDAGALWIGCETGLAQFDPLSGRFTRFSGNLERAAGLPEGEVGALLQDRAGTLWVGTTAGLFRRGHLAARFAPVKLPTANGAIAVPTVLLEDSGGRVWIGTLASGAYVEAAGDTAPTALRETGAGRMSLSDEHVTAILETGPQQVWIGTSGHGLVAIDAITHQTSRIRREADVPSSLSDDTIVALDRDRSGLLWVATNRGFSIHNPQQLVRTIFGPSTRPLGLPDSDVRSIAEMPDGHVWLGLGSNGIAILDARSGVVGVRQAAATQNGDRLPEASVGAIAPGPGGSVYVGTGRGLYRTSLQSPTVEPVALPGGNPDIVRSLLCTGNLLWVGHRGLSIFRLDQAGRPAAAPIHIGNQLGHLRVDALATDPSGSVWVGTHAGLNRVDQSFRVVETILPSADPGGLAPGGITSLLFDHAGRLWISSTGGGINILEPGGASGRRRLRHLGTDEGLPNANVDTLLQAADGAIWAGTDEGLARIDPITMHATALQGRDGVNLTDYWSNSGIVTAEGELLFGAVGGLTVVRPDRSQVSTFEPPVRITQAVMGGHPFLTSREPPGHDTPGWLIRPDGNSLRVEFAALDYLSPESNQYAYQLVGYDKDWTYTDALRRLADYTNLAPGQYRLRLRGSNHAGIWSRNALEVPITVLSAWYQTWWSKLVAIAALASLLLSLIQIRTSFLRIRQRQLERLIAERTTALRESARKLEQSQDELRRMAYSDPLTGLANRRRLTDECRELIRLSAQGKICAFALILIDLDRFKLINDTMGHDAGDALLLEVAARLRTVVREGDCLARMGGDEFAILLCDDHAADRAERIGQRIIGAFDHPVAFQGHMMRSSPSIGVAVFPRDGNGEEELYKSADLALYAAKAGGRNTWRAFGPEMRAG